MKARCFFFKLVRPERPTADAAECSPEGANPWDQKMAAAGWRMGRIDGDSLGQEELLYLLIGLFGVSRKGR